MWDFNVPTTSVLLITSTAQGHRLQLLLYTHQLSPKIQQQQALLTSAAATLGAQSTLQQVDEHCCLHVRSRLRNTAAAKAC